MNEFLLGLITPFVVLALVGAGFAAVEKIKEIRWNRRPRIVYSGICEICWGRFYANKKKSIREMYDEHMERQHKKEES